MPKNKSTQLQLVSKQICSSSDDEEPTTLARSSSDGDHPRRSSQRNNNKKVGFVNPFEGGPPHPGEEDSVAIVVAGTPVALHPGKAPPAEDLHEDSTNSSSAPTPPWRYFLLPGMVLPMMLACQKKANQLNPGSPWRFEPLLLLWVFVWGKISARGWCCVGSAAGGGGSLQFSGFRTKFIIQSRTFF